MRIALLSDTHGNHVGALRAIEQVTPVDLVIHLGDGQEDMRLIAPALNMPAHALAGNCDQFPAAPRELQLSLAGRTILATHGDLYRVKLGLAPLVQHAKSINAELVAFGHTHSALVTIVDGITLVNPGALAKGERYPSLAIVTLKNGGEISAEIVEVKG